MVFAFSFWFGALEGSVIFENLIHAGAEYLASSFNFGSGFDGSNCDPDTHRKLVLVHRRICLSSISSGFAYYGMNAFIVRDCDTILTRAAIPGNVVVISTSTGPK